MQRRHFVIAAGAAIALPARAHHGWSSFDQGRPVYLEGRAEKVAWRNPHVEMDLRVTPGLKVPADLARRTVPAQSASVDGAALFAKAVAPTRPDPVWHIELAPLSRVEAWKLPEIKDGQAVAFLGFTFAGEKGDAILRAEYVLVGEQTYGMRSSPA